MNYENRSSKISASYTFFNLKMLDIKSGLNYICTFHCYAIKRIKKLIGSRAYTVQVKGSNICVPS